MEGPEAAHVVALLAERTNTRAEDWHLVFKARYGMEVAFATWAKLGSRTRVATQVFTCCTAVDPVLAAGLSPVYLDVDPHRLALSADALASLAEAPLAVVDQHTYGIIDGRASAALAAAAHERGAWVLEDCAHCPGRMAVGERGPVADVSVHSFGVEKLLPSTRFGGAVYVNPAMEGEEVYEALCQVLDALPPIPPRLEKAVKAYRNQSRMLNHLPAAAAKAMNRKWIASGKREPAVAEAELKGELPLEPMAPGEWVCAQAVPDLEHLPANLAARSQAVAVYARELAELPGVFTPAGALSEPAQPLLRFPLFAASSEAAEAIRRSVEALGLYCTRWYRPLLFPGVDLAAFSVESFSAWPVSERLSEGALCLPTDLGGVEPQAVVAAVKAAL